MFETNFVPIPADYDLTDLFWLLDTNYTSEQKKEYVKLTLTELLKEHARIKTHDKLETLGDGIEDQPRTCDV